MSDENKVVSLVEYRNPDLPQKSNPALPDAVWARMQELGMVATEHLARLLTDPRFANFTVKDQMRVIETTFSRAYGSPDGSVRRHIHTTDDPEANKGYNAMRDMSKKASRRLPEFRPTDGELIEEAVLVRRQVRIDTGDED